jgi:ketosteroid isomerase-like protein
MGQCFSNEENGLQSNASELLNVERRFFSALIGQVAALDELLADDFLLIDVFSGTEVTKRDLLGVMRSGELKFEEIKRNEWRVRFYNGTAVVTGSTKMQGRFGGEPFAVSSRYTHIYAKLVDEWQLVSAQGTRTSTLLE